RCADDFSGVFCGLFGFPGRGRQLVDAGLVVPGKATHEENNYTE
ncbi:MAG: hypothetical protein ACI9TH_002627, partial [Kiritimatiellia bacterium]